MRRQNAFIGILLAVTVFFTSFTAVPTYATDEVNEPESSVNANVNHELSVKDKTSPMGKEVTNNSEIESTNSLERKSIDNSEGKSIDNSNIENKKDQSAPLNSKLKQIEQFLKNSGKLDQTKGLLDYKEKIPVLIVLKEDSKYNSVDFSYNSLESMCDKINLSQNYQEDFLNNVEKILNKDIDASAVNFILECSLKCELDPLDLIKIADMEEIERISLNYQNLKPGDEFENRSVSPMLCSRSAYNPKEIKGKGKIIAIIDTGFDTDHEDFVMEDVEGAKYIDEKSVNDVVDKINQAITNPLDKLQGKWINNKFPYGYNYSKNQANVKETGNSHGTHVAAIAAASKGYKGQAPAAQLLAMSVLAGENAQISSDVYLKAIEHSIILGASSINMSFGISSSTLRNTGTEILKVAEKARKAGILINVSTGNDNYTDSDYSSPKVDQPNYGTISSPALVADMMAVASIDSDVIRLPYIKVGDKKIPYYPCADKPLISVYDKPLEMIDVGHGTKEDLKRLPVDALKGKIALIERGINRFDEKVALVSSKGALAAIIYDNKHNDEWINMGIYDPNILAAFVHQSDGMSLKAKAREGIAVEIKKEIEIFKLDKAGKLSYFSSWGPTPEFDLKPEITAVGGHVWAAQPGNSHGDKSGTSMASPQVAGVVALLQERLQKDKDLQIPYPIEKGDNSGIHDFLKNMLMSNAIPYFKKDGDPYASPRKQGAGVMSKDNVLSSYALLSTKSTDEKRNVAKINLGAIDTEFNLKFTVYNLSKEKSLTFNKITATVQTDKLDERKPSFIVPVGAARILDDIVIGKTITLKPNTSQDITIPVDISSKDKALSEKFINGYFVEGFVKLSSDTENQCDVSIPYIGFRKVDEEGNKVEFYNIPVLERSIYEYDDLSNNSKDRPKYYTDKNHEESPFTALISKYKKRDIVLGEITPRESKSRPRVFSKDKIAFSPNGDGVQDFIQLRGVFLSQYVNDHIEIYDAKNNLIYKGEDNYSGKKNGEFVEVGRKNQAVLPDGSAGTLYSQSEKYMWKGQDTKGQNVDDGKYKFVFSVKGVAENAKEQKYSYDIYLDKTAPALTDVNISKNEITGKIIEKGSGLDWIALVNYDNDGNVIQSKRVDLSEENAFSIDYKNKKLYETYLEITDYAGNKFLKSLETIQAGENVGKVNVDVKGVYGIKTDDYQVEIFNSKNALQLNPKALPYGKYTAKLRLNTLEYTYKNDKEKSKEFEITKAEPNANVSFELQYSNIKEVQLPVLTSFPRGDFGNTARPEIIFTNSMGIKVKSRANIAFGSGAYFSGKLSEGKWQAEVASTEKGYKLIPEVLNFTVDSNGKVVDNDDLPFLYVGPKLNQLLPQFDIKDAGIKENDIKVEATYVNKKDKQHKWNGKKFDKKYFSNLPPAFYKVKPILPVGYYADPAQVEVDLNENNQAPTFNIYKKGKNDKGSFSVYMKVDKRLDGNFPAEYTVENDQGTKITEFNNLPYGMYTVKITNTVEGYVPDTMEKEFSLGPSSDKAVIFNWSSLSNSDKKGTLAIFPDWNYMEYGNMYKFNSTLNNKPYIYVLKRLDKTEKVLTFQEGYPGYNARMELKDIPYGIYEFSADLSGNKDYYVDKPKAVITIGKDRTTLNIKYSKNPIVILPHNVKLEQGKDATINANKVSAKVAEKVTVTVNITDNTKKLIGIFVNDNFVKAEENNQVSFFMPDKDVVVKAKLGEIKAKRKIEVEKSLHGKVIADKSLAEHGEGVTLTVIPDEGYHVKRLKYNDVNIINNEFLMPDFDITIKAVFEKTPIELYKLIQAIKFAKEKKENVFVSEKNGKDILPDHRYVTQEVQDALDNALKKAENVFKNPTTQKDVDAAEKALNEAISGYNPERGTGVAIEIYKNRLKASLKIAKKMKADIIDNDGNNVPTDKTWIKKEIQDKFDIAVKNAEFILKTSATVEQLREAYDALSNILNIYVPQRGNKKVDEGQGGTGGTPSISGGTGSGSGGSGGSGSSGGSGGSSSSNTADNNSGKDTAAKQPKTSQDKGKNESIDSVKPVDNAPAEKVAGFSDVTTRDWFAAPVQYVVKNNIMNGTENGFAPNSTTTRGMIATILYRMEGMPKVTEKSKFMDVEAGQWYTDGIVYGAKNGILNGISDKEFAPKKNISREEMAVMLYRYAKLKNYDGSVKGNLDAFSDKDSVSNYAKDAMKWCVDKGLINGKDGKLAPKSFATRAEVAAMMERFMKNVVKVA